MDEKPAAIRRAQARQRPSGRKKAGMKFEKDVHEHFGAMYGDSYIPGQWMEFKAAGDMRFRAVQTDAVHINLDAGILTIFEIKLKHNIRAWWQLRRLYEPVLRHAFPNWITRVVEVYRWHDPGCMLPEPVHVTQDPLHPTDRYKVLKLQGVA